MNKQLHLLVTISLLAFAAAAQTTHPQQLPMNAEEDRKLDEGLVHALTLMEMRSTQEEFSGKVICGHLLDEHTSVDALMGNPAQKEAVAMSWPAETKTPVHTAIFIRGTGRCVVRDGDVIDQKLIVAALPNWIAVSEQHGLVAWEADYFNVPKGNGYEEARKGLFFENHFIGEIDPSEMTAFERGASYREPDFRWSDKTETVITKQYLLLPNANVNPAPKPLPVAAAPQKAALPTATAKPCVDANGKQAQVSVSIPPKARKSIREALIKLSRVSGIPIDPNQVNNPIYTATPVCSAAPPKQ